MQLRDPDTGVQLCPAAGLPHNGNNSAAEQPQNGDLMKLKSVLVLSALSGMLMSSAAMAETRSAGLNLLQGPAWGSAPVRALEDSGDATLQCMDSFNESRDKVQSATTQSVIIFSGSNNVIAPYITLQSNGLNGKHYVLWQSLNGEVRGYALRDGKGFDYANSAGSSHPLTWHPTLIWDNLFGSRKELKNYSCVLTGRTRVMGRGVSLIRLIPQEGLRYSFILAKEDESDFPIELTIVDSKGTVSGRLTTMDSRIIGGIDFPIADAVFDKAEKGEADFEARRSSVRHDQNDSRDENDSSITARKSGQTASMLADSVQLSTPPCADGDDKCKQTTGAESALAGGALSTDTTSQAGASLNASGRDGRLAASADKKQTDIPHNRKKIWQELSIPDVYTLASTGDYPEGGPECIYQEFSDGLTSFRVYRNKRSSIFYPVLSNGTLTIVRKNSSSHEYSVVGEVPVSLAEYVLKRIHD